MQIEAGGAGALVGRQRQVRAVRQAHDLHGNGHCSSPPDWCSAPLSACAIRATSAAATASLPCGGQDFDAAARDQVHRIDIAAHHAGFRRHVVGEDPVAAFLRELACGRSPRRSGFPRRSRPPAPAASTCAAPSSRGCRGSRASASSGVPPAPFLIFCRGFSRRSPVRYGRGEHRDVGRQRRLDRAQHVARGLDLDHAHARRIGHVHRPRHQRHLRARRRRGRSDGMALLAGRAVGDVAHRIDRLVRRPRRHQHALAGERAALAPSTTRAPLPRSRAAPPCGRARLRSPPPSRRRSARPRATPSAISVARLRFVSRGAPTSPGSSPARSECARRVASSTAVARSSARPCAILRDEIGGRRRHHDQLGLARQADVADVELAVADRTDR